MRVLALVLLAGALSPCLAQKYAPVPDAIRDAKTVYLLNHAGFPEALDAAYKELRKWGRFELVTDRSKADLVFVLTAEEHDAGSNSGTFGNMAYSRRVIGGVTFLQVFGASGNEPIWETSHAWKDGGAKTCVKDLKKRLDQNTN